MLLPPPFIQCTLPIPVFLTESVPEFVSLLVWFLLFLVCGALLTLNRPIKQLLASAACLLVARCIISIGLQPTLWMLGFLQVTICCMVVVCMLYGCCMDVVWMLYGCCIHAVWMLYGCCMDVVWMLYACCIHAVWLLYACCMHAVWLLYGCCMHAVSMLYGCCIHAVWLLYACCMHVVCMLLEVETPRDFARVSAYLT